MLWSPIPNGKVSSAHTVAMSADGQRVHVFARGGDNRMWRAFSPNSGMSWPVAWKPIGDKRFAWAPAAVMTSDGTMLHLFGRAAGGTFLHARPSVDPSAPPPSWKAVGGGTFVSSPAAAISPGGQVQVLGWAGTLRCGAAWARARRLRAHGPRSPASRRSNRGAARRVVA